MFEDEIVKVEHLSVKYKDFTAVSDVSLSIKENEVFGIIGANGAGKTSLIESIEGLRVPSAGKISVLGMEPHKERTALYEKVGVQLQETSYPDNAKVQDVCELFSSFYENPIPYEDLLKEIGISDIKKKRVNKLSGGQKQRLSIVLSLLPNPKIVFWDELTTGLDPIARHNLYERILQYKKKNLTIVLITHFMEEVEKLCDRIAVMKSGKILAVGTPSQIVQSFNVDNLDELFVKISNE